MAPRKFQFALREILDEIAWIDQVTASKTFADFEADRLLRYGVERSLEVVSEASRRIPDDLKATQAQIDWPAIAGIGNVMRHEYHSTSPEIIWNVVQKHLAPLREAVQAIAGAYPDPDAQSETKPGAR